MLKFLKPYFKLVNEDFLLQEITCDARTRRALGNKDLACDHCDYKTTLLKRHNDSIHKENLIMRQRGSETNEINENDMC